MTLFHNSQDEKYRTPFGATCTDSVVQLSLDINSDECPKEVLLLFKAGECEQAYPMAIEKTDNGYRAGACIKMPEAPCLAWYCFVAKWSNGELFYGNNAQKTGGIGAECSQNPDFYQITVFDKNLTVPQWFAGRIMYQIFPDRFFGVHENGYIPKKREEYIVHYDTNEPISHNRHFCEDGPACNDFYGGNLKGITEKLDYIKSLGVGVIYLNPIFDAYSNHKYDTANYKEIDFMFGTEEDFKELCQKAKERDIRIILDGVFSHTGADSIYFNKYGTYGDGGAYKDINSPYREWYSFNDKGYDSWWGCSNLPNVNEMNDKYLDYILRDEDSVIKKWLRLGASGWRLDVADELPDEFIEILRKEAKSEKDDALIIGEVWEDASNKIAYSKQRRYLLGAELDSVMNYPFRDGVVDFLMGNKRAEDINKRFMSIMENYPIAILYSLMNLIGTHDTMRIKSLFGGLDENCKDTRLSSGVEALATYRLLCAIFMQMTFVGVPSIYYGDEIGMQGGRDPYNRGYFTWRCMDNEVLTATQKLGEMRNSLKALQTGFYKTVYAKDNVFVYARYFENGKDVFGEKSDGSFAICAINRSFEKEEVEIDISEFEHGELKCAWGDFEEPDRDKLRLKVDPIKFTFVYSKE